MKIGTAPGKGVGWFWARRKDLPTPTIFAVDENGGGYDFDRDGLWD